MKKQHHLTKILAALIFCTFFFGSAYSQQIISSVNVNKTTEFINDLISTDNELELNSKKYENWLSHKSYLHYSSSADMFMLKLELYSAVLESELEIEDWMTDDQFWLLNNSNNSSDAKYGEIEDWMMDDNFWVIESGEDIIPIEPWMLDDEFWVVDN